LIKCFGFVGLDGLCKGTNDEPDSVCSLRLCTDSGLDSEEICNKYQLDCTWDGTKCMKEKSCPNTLNLMSCSGTTGCGWNNICQYSGSCSWFNNESTCVNSLGGKKYKLICYWDSGCKDICQKADSTYDTDDKCKALHP